MSWFLGTAIATSVYGLAAGLLVPGIIGHVPEPRPEPEPEPELRPESEPELWQESGQERQAENDEAGATARPETPKELYADIARRPGLRWKSALATALVAGLLGGRIGWTPELAFLLYLAPVGVALAVIDWRTRLLPTKLIAPSYVVVAGLVVVAAWSEGDWGRLAGAGAGWLVAGGTFFALWFVYPKGMGYGDVRLSGLLGITLGCLGWGELLTGVYAGFLLGGVGGLVLSWLRIVDRKAYPFGPFMLVGALVGVLAGPNLAAWYA